MNDNHAFDSAPAESVQHNDEVVPERPSLAACAAGNSVSKTVLTVAHTSDLAKSGIPAAEAVRFGLSSITEEEVRKLLGRRQSVGAGLKIPYPDPNTGGPLVVQAPGGRGAAVEVVRIRLDNPALALDGDGKPCKYLSLKGISQFPYITPDLATRCRAGTVATLYIAEGEKKAICGIVKGLDVVGLPGNWGWKVRQGSALHPMLATLLRPGMTVVVVWDSDAVLNTGFAASTRLLHSALLAAGCQVKVIVLPQAGMAKVGLDDYLVANGRDAFNALVAAAPLLPADRGVSASELMTGWLPALEPALGSLSPEDSEKLLRKTLAKGLVDEVDDELRRAVLYKLRTWTTVDVGALMRVLAGEYAAMNHPAIGNTEGDEGGKGEGVVDGGRGRLPDGSRVAVIRIDGDVCWVGRRAGNAKTWPVPLRALVAEADGQTGPAPGAADVADEFLGRHYLIDGIVTLRWYRGRFFRWADGAYRECSEDEIRSLLMGFLREKHRGRAIPAFASAILANLRAAGVCHVPPVLQPPAWLGSENVGDPADFIAFPNGILDINALTRDADDSEIFRPPTPALLTLNGMEFPFDPSAECPVFLKFLEEVQPDPEIRSLLQEIAGYFLQADTSLQRFFMLVGEGSNGKGVFCNILTALLGPGNVCAIPLSRFGERFSTWPLTTKLLNCVAEMPGAESAGAFRLAEDKLKAIVAGDPIEIERKGKDILTAVPTARLLFATNELPHFVDRTNGIWRRLITVPFLVEFTGNRVDPNLAAKIISTELPGVFNWALEGLLRLRERGDFSVPEACEKLKADHRAACDHEAEFLRDFCSAGTSLDFVPTAGLHQQYVEFCRANSYRPVAKNQLSTALRRLFPEAVSGRQLVGWHMWPTLWAKGPARGFYHVKFHHCGVPQPPASGKAQDVGGNA